MKHVTIMPEMIMHRIQKGNERTCIIAKSNTGNPVATFNDEEQARQWKRLRPNHRIVFFKQTITEEEVQINI